jgi:secreted PhoX family phosphatase
MTKFNPEITRRELVKGGATGAATVAFGALAARNAAAVQLPYSDDYGPVDAVLDQTTGLPLLKLPQGFTYKTYGWRGQPMADGQATPGAHDGMGVVAAKGNQIALVRNHEQSGSGIVFRAPADYDSLNNNRGGNTNILFDTVTGKFLTSYASLSGTRTNCAGGVTPWGTWLSCEETTSITNGVRHGYVFEVPGFGRATGRPLKGLGRFSHEAATVDSGTGHVYLSEDATPSALYKFEASVYGNLEAPGKLYALKVKGQDDFNFSGLGGVYVDFPVGTTWDVEWVEVTDPDAVNGRAYNSAPGRACFARGEGMWEDGGKMYFVSTSGGVAREGQVFVYDPRRETLTIIFNSTGNGTGDTNCNNPDNICVSPRGGILLQEDGGGLCRMRGLNHDGKTFIFAENNIVLSAADIAQADAALNAKGGIIANMSANSYLGSEFAGGTFYGRWLFVNIQSPGITFAITGPWDNGSL